MVLAMLHEFLIMLVGHTPQFSLYKCTRACAVLRTQELQQIVTADYDCVDQKDVSAVLHIYGGGDSFSFLDCAISKSAVLVRVLSPSSQSDEAVVNRCFAVQILNIAGAPFSINSFTTSRCLPGS